MWGGSEYQITGADDPDADPDPGIADVSCIGHIFVKLGGTKDEKVFKR